MIKVKTFVLHENNCHPKHVHYLDEEINAFLESDEVGELVDIKYSTGHSVASDGREVLYSWLPSAMVIYKTK